MGFSLRPDNNASCKSDRQCLFGGKILVGSWKQSTKYDSFAGYQVSLIDNVHSDVARLRGFYGDLRIDR